MSLIACESIHQGHERFILVMNLEEGKNTFIRSKLLTAVCWSREKREEGVNETCFMSKASQIIRSILCPLRR